jgi:hypothetical protein
MMCVGILLNVHTRHPIMTVLYLNMDNILFLCVTFRVFPCLRGFTSRSPAERLHVLNTSTVNTQFCACLNLLF